MSILIKGATLPDSCWDCEADFAYKIGCELWQDFEGFCEHRHPNCPLVEIPTPHGRLIDADKLRKGFSRTESGYCGYWEFCDKPEDMQFLIDDEPTILEAEE